MRLTYTSPIRMDVFRVLFRGIMRGISLFLKVQVLKSLFKKFYRTASGNFSSLTVHQVECSFVFLHRKKLWAGNHSLQLLIIRAKYKFAWFWRLLLFMCGHWLVLTCFFLCWKKKFNVLNFYVEKKIQCIKFVHQNTVEICPCVVQIMPR